ncbi:MAG: PAS domain-containing protein [Burkholderiales bacterium]|nr:PAS domain-containing protein [Burkholderiales bacterium]
MQRRMLSATILLTLLASVLTWWMLRRQLAPLTTAAGTLAAMSTSEQPPRPLPITRQDEIGQVIGGFNSLLLTLAQREEALKRSERKFLDILENVEAYLYLKDTQGRYTFANRTMRRLCGVSMEGIVGKTDDVFLDPDTVAQLQANDRKVLEQGMTLKTEETVFNLATGTTSVHLSVKLPLRNEEGDIYALCGISTDITDIRKQEAKRLADEAAHRGALVREVHHRIKNNLQGITGMLRQFTAAHPESTDVINQAINQVHSIAVLHGLQGRKSMDTVRLCELTSAIAGDVQAVWQVPILIDIPPRWIAGIVAESEAVPMALVINELIVNAVKHGGKASGQVHVTLRKGDRPEVILVSIENAGRLHPGTEQVPGHHIGLHLVNSLMPRHGVTLTREQHDATVITRLYVEPPVVTLEQKEFHESEQHNTASSPLAGR